MRSDELMLPAYAKINLTLDVGGRRPDGYHDIRSIMQTIGLHDTLTVRRAPERTGVSLEVFGDESAGVPADESNLVHRAAVCLQNLAATRGFPSAAEWGLHLRLEKRIPSQAGLGGGSSNAAKTLRLLDQFFALNLSKLELERIGATLGADVPFFLTSGTALVEGLGERVTPLPPLEPAWDILIVKATVGIPTASAYAALDALPRRVPGEATAAWLSGTHIVSNDFSPVAAAVPEIAAVFQALPDAPLMLCGSGAALFCRVQSEAEGREWAARVEEQGLGKVWRTRTVGQDT